jgi:TatD DNase family protein
MFVDSHCHLEGPKYDGDRRAVLERAAAAGIAALLAVGNGTGPGTFDCGIRVAEASYGDLTAPLPRIYTSVGIHPHEAKTADDAALAELARLAEHPQVIAWGEIGLDYWYDFSPREVQRRVFVRQMELARAAKKPIIIHCRNPKDGNDAWTDALRLLRLNWAATGLGGILHCFSGSLDEMKAGVDLGFLISFAGNVTFPAAEQIRAAAGKAPLEHLLIETDSPYLAPVPHRGHRNEPAWVVEVADRVGRQRGMTAEEIGVATSQNFYRFFRILPQQTQSPHLP